MASEVDEVVARAQDTIERVRTRPARARSYGVARGTRRVARFAALAAGGLIILLILSIFWGLVMPLGVGGILIIAIAAALVVVGAALFSREADVTAQTIAQASLPDLAERTDRWLDQQRRALPAPAQTLADSIGERLAAIGPQIAALDPRGAEAVELRRMVGEDLPDLVERYARVPEHLRREERNGRVAEADLVEGMRVLDRQLDEFGRNLAATDMDRLASHKRYLELRYEGDGQ